MAKHYITLNCTQAETAYRLKQQLRVYPPRGVVEENHFRIYRKSSPFLGKGNVDSFYCLKGNYQQAGKVTYVSYRVWPGLPVFLTYMVAAMLVLSAFYDVIVRDAPIIIAVILLGFAALAILLAQRAKKECIADFEKRLQTEIHYKN